MAGFGCVIPVRQNGQNRLCVCLYISLSFLAYGGRPLRFRFFCHEKCHEADTGNSRLGFCTIEFREVPLIFFDCDLLPFLDGYVTFLL